MKLYAVIGQNPGLSNNSSTVPSPPPVAEWGILIALCTWLGKQFWGYFQQKETAESTLVNSLITDLRNTQSQLVNDLKVSQEKLIQEIQFKDSVTRLLEGTRSDMQRYTQGQTSMFVSISEEVKAVDRKVEALHSRLDSVCAYLEGKGGLIYRRLEMGKDKNDI